MYCLENRLIAVRKVLPSIGHQGNRKLPWECDSGRDSYLRGMEAASRLEGIVDAAADPGLKEIPGTQHPGSRVDLMARGKGAGHTAEGSVTLPPSQGGKYRLLCPWVSGKPLAHGLHVCLAPLGGRMGYDSLAEACGFGMLGLRRWCWP